MFAVLQSPRRAICFCTSAVSQACWAVVASVTIEVHLAAAAVVVGDGVAEPVAAADVVAAAEVVGAAEVAGADVAAPLVAPAASKALDSARPLLVGLGLTAGADFVVVAAADGLVEVVAGALVGLAAPLV